MDTHSHITMWMISLTVTDRPCTHDIVIIMTIATRLYMLSNSVCRKVKSCLPWTILQPTVSWVHGHRASLCQNSPHNIKG